MASCYNFGVEIEAIAEPHNRGQQIAEITSSNLVYWYEKSVTALRNRKGTDDMATKAAESKSRKYRKKIDRKLPRWITWDGPSSSPNGQNIQVVR